MQEDGSTSCEMMNITVQWGTIFVFPISQPDQWTLNVMKDALNADYEAYRLVDIAFCDDQISAESAVQALLHIKNQLQQIN